MNCLVMVVEIVKNKYMEKINSHSSLEFKIVLNLTEGKPMTDYQHIEIIHKDEL